MKEWNLCDVFPPISWQRCSREPPRTGVSAQTNYGAGYPYSGAAGTYGSAYGGYPSYSGSSGYSAPSQYGSYGQSGSYGQYGSTGQYGQYGSYGQPSYGQYGYTQPSSTYGYTQPYSGSGYSQPGAYGYNPNAYSTTPSGNSYTGSLGAPWSSPYSGSSYNGSGYPGSGYNGAGYAGAPGGYPSGTNSYPNAPAPYSGSGPNGYQAGGPVYGPPANYSAPTPPYPSATAPQTTNPSGNPNYTLGQYMYGVGAATSTPYGVQTGQQQITPYNQGAIASYLTGVPGFPAQAGQPGVLFQQPIDLGQ